MEEIVKYEGDSKRRGSVSSLLSGNFGKLPPQAVDLEEAILGSVMLEKNCIDDAMRLLHEDFFYKDTHSIIFKAARQLYNNHQPVDILTVTNELKRTGELDIVGGPFFITQLTGRVASSANFEFHSMIIKQKWAQRELIRISSEAIRDSYEDTTDIFIAKNNLDNGLQLIGERLIGTGGASTWQDQLDDNVKELEQQFKNPVKLNGVTTGSIKLDRITGGWQNTDLIILAARPGMGKSARSAMFVKHACLDGKSALFFSLEMGSGQITKRFLYEASGVHNDKIKTRTFSNIDLEKIKESAKALSSMNFQLIDKPALTPNDIRSYARLRKKKAGLDLVVIDYLQLVKPNTYEKTKTRDRELAEITGSLKELAKELNIPIIALSQLSRQVDARLDKRPMLSDLRESGAIEQDADMVLFLYRPSEYHSYADREKKEPFYKNHTEADYYMASEILIAKFRNGAPASAIEEHFIGPLTRFTTIEEENKEQPPVPVQQRLVIPDPDPEFFDDYPAPF